MAKPKHILTPDEKRLILALYELGKTDAEVATIMNLPRRTFTDILRYNSITTTIKRQHKNIADSKVELSLYNQAVGGNITAIIYWLGNRQADRWKSVNYTRVGGDDKAPPVELRFIGDLKGLPDNKIKKR